MSELSSLKNIGKEMERKLNEVGIKSIDDLRRIGSKAAFVRLRESFPNVCLVHLQSLEGAIEDVMLQDLSEEIKTDLKEFSDYLKKEKRCVKRIVKESFSVIGIEGSGLKQEGFVQNCWMEANARFKEIAPLAKKDEEGNYCGFWGAMSDLGREFKPWEENFSKGLYLAGVECIDEAEAPEGWTKWTLPGFEYLVLANQEAETFRKGLHYLEISGYDLAGAVQDFTCPKTGENFMLFPIRRID